MQTKNNSLDKNQFAETGAKESPDDSLAEKESIWQQINQHFQTTQTCLTLRLVCKGKEVQQVGDVLSGLREAARLFTLHESPQKAEELVASVENLFNRKCQQWDQAAKAAEAQERAKATGGGQGSADSAANRRKLESAHNAVRHRVTSAKQCFRRLRTALNRGLSFGHKKYSDIESASDNVPTKPLANQSSQRNSGDKPQAQNSPSDIGSGSGPELAKPPTNKLIESLKSLIGAGAKLNYATAPFLDPFCEEGVKSREAIWDESEFYCFIVQWEECRDRALNLKFWIVPRRPEFVEDLVSDQQPDLFLHQRGSAERLNFELVVHNTKNGPSTNEMNQLMNRIESERFLSGESGKKLTLRYLTSSVNTQTDFDLAIQQPYLLELL
ncbi:MAG: hypothetical protein AB8B55_03305 [Mariniblastus sp.]